MQSAGLEAFAPRHAGLDIQQNSAPSLPRANSRKHSAVYDYLQRSSWDGFSFFRSKDADRDVSYLSDLSTKGTRSHRHRSLDSELDAVKEENLKDRVSVSQSTGVDRLRFSLLSSRFDSSIQVANIEELLIHDGPFHDIANGEVRDGVWWLDVTSPSKEEVETLSRIFNIHPLTTEDIMTEEPREKTELFEKYYFLSLTLSQLSDKGSDHRPSNMYAIVFRNGILSFSFSDNPHTANVRRRIKNLKSHLNVTSDWICYALIDDIVDGFETLVHEAERELVAIEDNYAIARPDDVGWVLRQIHECRKKVSGARHLLGGKVDVIRSFARRCDERYSITPSSELGLYLSDIQDHVVTMMTSLIQFEQILARVHATLLARLSVDSTRTGSMTIKFLSKISVIAAILVPMQVITGLFGMNTPVPGGSTNGLEWWFGILGVIGTLVVVSLIIARMAKFI
ncbi:putative cora family metal ion transporter [Paecilomyces variotii]|uniref:Putative cora family metal ion transporter n=1 Tax=Byssochlamys spectabilis TaxID=264951 RepID=A0A443HX23_BYSSP|nr:putative cora family metal ion transporter [Paecilomyces variotii]KAJ9226761.1 hypothetical protein DTO169C6_1001 [Paecilomyces variotii]KAJ9231891.1 hypothetical protein DTO169E5_7714 [Paecilomyces variotii]KAJ9253628.1 hypothetical protein DTO207G8_4052 [Paecilomyces variotii]KAJ9267682.1 hypothetical protein DTO195F2_16 [Paecilomyces variotii]KAJ9287606.1 hypothetical protein DTO021C3_4899 [Paecilomyces variotii]